MTARWLKTVFATLVVGVVSVGTAAAAPIVVGQWTWTEDEFMGVTFAVANTSTAPQPELGPETGWTADDFVGLAITVTGPICGASSPCDLEPLSIEPTGFSQWPLAFVSPGDILSATLSFSFKGTPLQFTLDAQALQGDDIRIADRSLTYEFDYTPVPEPSSLLLLASAAGLSVAMRRRRRA